MIYHSEDPYFPGNTTKSYFKAVGSSVEVMQTLYREYGAQDGKFNFSPDHEDMGVLIQMPPKVKILQSPALPRLLIPVDQLESLKERVEMIPLPESYLNLVQWLIKKEWIQDYGADLPSDQQVKDVESRIRLRLVRLLTDGQWIDTYTPEWEGSPVQSLNRRLEKIDLGRRKDLKYSSNQSPEALARSERLRGMYAVKMEREQERKFAAQESTERRRLGQKPDLQEKIVPEWQKHKKQHGLNF